MDVTCFVFSYWTYGFHALDHNKVYRYNEDNAITPIQPSESLASLFQIVQKNKFYWPDQKLVEICGKMQWLQVILTF